MTNPDEMWYAKIQLHTKNENYNPEYSIKYNYWQYSF